MSCRIVRRQGTADFERVAWRRIGEPEVEETPIADEEIPAPEPPPPPPPAPDTSVVDELHERLAGLEREMTVRLAEAKREGHQAGFRDGEAAANEQAAKRMAEERERSGAELARSVEEMLAFRLRIRQQLERDLVRLAVIIARRILHRELQVDPDALLGIVKAAVARIDSRELLRVVVARSDVEHVRARLAGMALPARVEVAGDASLPSGSVRLATERGELDASIHTQLEEIDRGLADMVRRSA